MFVRGHNQEESIKQHNYKQEAILIVTAIITNINRNPHKYQQKTTQTINKNKYKSYKQSMHVLISINTITNISQYE